MARATKRAKRAARRVTGMLSGAVIAITPPAVRERLAPSARYLEMLFLDHLFLRLVFPNRHRLSADAWRAAQPLPHQVKRLAREGIRTIINLRGDTQSASYGFEEEACAAVGIKLENFRIKSRAAPSREELLAARELFNRVEYPMLMHCKSGADRVGLMSALYRHVRHDVPIAEAKRELSLRYGHMRQADTGVLDYFFERYLADTREKPMSFYDWVETVYDPVELKRSFHANSWANRIVDGILRRE